MPKPFSRNFIAVLAAYKTPKPPAPKASPTATSSYNNVNDSTDTSDFGTSSTRLQPYTYTDPLTGKTSTKNQLATTSTLSPDLQPIKTTAETGLGNNLSYLNGNPQQQASNALAGNDPYYNVLQDQEKKAESQAGGALALKAQGTGNLNSTTYGSALGTFNSDAQQRNNQNLLGALQYGNQVATGNVGTNAGVLAGLNGLTSPLGTATAATLQNGLNQNNQVALANAQIQQANTAAQNAYQQQLYQYKQNQAFGGALGAYGNFIDPLGFSTHPGQAVGQFAQIAGAALGGFPGAAVGAGVGALGNQSLVTH